MRLKFRLLVVTLALGSSIGAQEIVSLLPPSSRANAAKLMDSMDRASAIVGSKRLAAWKTQLAAESDAVQAYALIAAAKAGKRPWATPDGSIKSSEAPGILSSARARARAAAFALASGEDGSSSYAKTRDEAAKSLAASIRSSEIGAKTAIMLRKKLSTRNGTETLFPEAREIGELLCEAGAGGAREAAAAAARGNAEGRGLALIESKSRILAIAPRAEAPLSRLEVVLHAYRSWLDGSPYVFYPVDNSSSPELGLSAVSSGITALAGLGGSRLHSLVAAMEKGDGRDASAAHAAEVLAAIWTRSPEPRRRALAAAFGVSESVMSIFCFALAPDEEPKDGTAAQDPIASIKSLNGMAAAMSGGEGKVGAKGAEPALLILERPDLNAVARAESRYATIYTEASARVDAIYARSAEDAASKLETASAVIGAATRALGAAPSGLSIRAVDLRGSSRESGRSLAFEATATDAGGDSISIPIDAELAGKIYAFAFASAAGIDTPKPDPGAFLEKYGQRLVSAYNPSASDDSLGIDSFPRRGGGHRLSSIDLEIAILGGWRP
jgi:hypothetical protein